MQAESYKQKLVFFIRHGERGDLSTEPHEKEKLEKQHDCHLTDHGAFQAQIAGEKIATMIKEQYPHINKLKLISSPLLRCLMTSENFAKGANMDIVNNEINVHNGVGELLLSWLFDHCPYKDGLMYRQYPEKVTEKYVSNLKIVDKEPEVGIPDFPEGDEEYQCFDRIMRGFKCVTQEFFEQVDKGELEDCALVILTHGGVVGGILSVLEQFDKEISYQLTNINAFLYENKEQESLSVLPKILTKQNSDHLAEAKARYEEYRKSLYKE